jgi:hypothetical protein
MKTIFLSLGTPYNERYQTFAKCLIDFFAREGFALKSVGYNIGSHQGPMKKIVQVFEESKGAVIVAFKRINISSGTEKETEPLSDVCLATPWNQIEAAMAFDRGLPLLMIVEKGLRRDGMFEYGPDWYVFEMELIPEDLHSDKFRLIFNEWKEAVSRPCNSLVNFNPADITLGRMFSSMHIRHVISIIAGIAALLFLAFELGVYVAGR